MPNVRRPCPTPGCPNLSGGGACTDCRHAAESRRGSRHARGYDSRWERYRRPAYLGRNPLCCLCSAPASVPDHYPLSRRQLVANGVLDPDADRHLRPLCDHCHRVESAKNQPGGWNAR